MKKLTDKQFWTKYWSTKKTTKIVGSNYPFSDLFASVLTRNTSGSMIEIGGFPGYFAIFFQKYWHYKTTLLDYYINEKFLQSIWKDNNIDKKDIKVFKADFFHYKTAKQYDLVYSMGFIEHFDNTEDVIARHWKFVKKGGEMLITLPNFLGLNGHMQLSWDPDNLNKHNLECMDIVRLESILDALHITQAKVFYWGGLRVWLEDLGSRTLWQKFVVGCLYVLGIVIKKLGINNKFLSPYIVIYAKK